MKDADNMNLIALLEAMQREQQDAVVGKAVEKALGEHDKLANERKKKSSLRAAHPEGCIASSKGTLRTHLAAIKHRKTDIPREAETLQQTLQELQPRQLEEEMFSHSLSNFLGALETEARLVIKSMESLPGRTGRLRSSKAGRER